MEQNISRILDFRSDLSILILYRINNLFSLNQLLEIMKMRISNFDYEGVKQKILMNKLHYITSAFETLPPQEGYKFLTTTTKMRPLVMIFDCEEDEEEEKEKEKEEEEEKEKEKEKDEREEEEEKEKEKEEDKEELYSSASLLNESIMNRALMRTIKEIDGNDERIYNLSNSLREYINERESQLEFIFNTLSLLDKYEGLYTVGLAWNSNSYLKDILNNMNLEDYMDRDIIDNVYTIPEFKESLYFNLKQWLEEDSYKKKVILNKADLGVNKLKILTIQEMIDFCESVNIIYNPSWDLKHFQNYLHTQLYLNKEVLNNFLNDFNLK
jgi:flagellar biosynthesis GTPase FlhF